MSNNKKETEKNEHKVVTKYDLKMLRRKEQKEKEQKEKRIYRAVGIVILAAVVCFIASFPINTYFVTNGEYITVGSEKVTQLEFDYNYNVVKNNYLNQFGSYASYFGLDVTQDLSTQMYTDTLSWKDFFEQTAVENMIQSKALLKEAEATGFTHDTTEEFKEFEENMNTAASEAGISLRNYIKAAYGSYATLGRISEFVKNDMIIAAYIEQVQDELTPEDSEIQAYYEDAPDDYDSVDYRLEIVKAELPTAPTELADPVAETTTDADAAATEETAYEPSEAEIEKAMADAKVLADAAEATIAKDGELVENVTKAYAATAISDWLFDSSRKAGDTTVIQDDINSQYYVLAFEKRYLDQTMGANVRTIITTQKAGEEILDEWKSGAATEDSFAELCKQYSEDSTASSGGLNEGVTASDMPEELHAWLFEETRASGDTVAIDSEDGSTHYVLYYVSQGDPEWKQSIKSTLSTEAVNAYLEEITADIQVSDVKGKLNYLKVQAEEEANAEPETEESAEVSESSQTE